MKAILVIFYLYFATYSMADTCQIVCYSEKNNSEPAYNIHIHILDQLREINRKLELLANPDIEPCNTEGEIKIRTLLPTLKTQELICFGGIWIIIK